MDNFSYKKKSSQQSNILEETHFAVCPYLIQIQTNIDYIFTINFQKDCQIIGQLSRLILPASQNCKINLEPDKNIMFFRVAKDKKSHYKWALYRRNQKGKQQIVQIIKVTLKDIIDNYLKFQMAQKQSLLKSKLKSQSTQQIIKSFKQSKFIKSGILLHYLFLISAHQNKIVEAVKIFKLQEKLNVVQKAFNLIVPRNNLQNSKIRNENINYNEEKEELIQKKEKGKQQKMIQFIDLINKQKQKEKRIIPEQLQKKKPFIKNQKSSGTQSLKYKVQFFHNNQMQLKKPISQLQNNNNKNNQNQINKISQVNIKNQFNNGKTQIKLYQTKQNIKKLKTKDSFTNLKQEFDQIQYNQQTKQLQHFKVNQIQETYHDHQIKNLNLALTDPSKHFKQSQLSIKNQDISGTSYLKLDDIILNDKRISISDKSSWMHTSKSKTDSKDNQINKKELLSIHNLPKEDNYSDELMINSKSPSYIDQKFNLLTKKLQNQQKSILKRGISINDKKVYDQINMSHHKPKTLGEQQIRQSLNQNMYMRIHSRDDLETNKQDKKIDNKKYIINIPSMIQEDVELSRSFEPDNSRGNSLSEKRDNFQIEDEWGNGISQISKLSQQQLQKINRNWIDKNILEIQKFFAPKFKPVIKRIQKNQWANKNYKKVKPFLSTKKIILVILFVIVFLTFVFFWNTREPLKNNFEKNIKRNKKQKNKKKKSIISKYLK